MTGVGLEHGGAELDARGRLGRPGHGEEGFAVDGAGEPDAREAVGFGRLDLLDDPIRGAGAPADTDVHGLTLNEPRRLRLGGSGRRWGSGAAPPGSVEPNRATRCRSGGRDPCLAVRVSSASAGDGPAAREEEAMEWG